MVVQLARVGGAIPPLLAFIFVLCDELRVPVNKNYVMECKMASPVLMNDLEQGCRWGDNQEVLLMSMWQRKWISFFYIRMLSVEHTYVYNIKVLAA